jgi:hypothetical protein
LRSSPLARSTAAARSAASGIVAGVIPARMASHSPASDWKNRPIAVPSATSAAIVSTSSAAAADASMRVEASPRKSAEVDTCSKALVTGGDETIASGSAVPRLAVENDAKAVLLVARAWANQVASLRT